MIFCFLKSKGNFAKKMTSYNHTNGPIHLSAVKSSFPLRGMLNNYTVLVRYPVFSLEYMSYETNKSQIYVYSTLLPGTKSGYT